MISGLMETFIKRYIVERTNEAEIRPKERRVVGRTYGMKYSWKGHKDRNRHKNRIKQRASSVGLCLWHKPQHPHCVKVSPRGQCGSLYLDKESGERERERERLIPSAVFASNTTERLFFPPQRQLDPLEESNWPAARSGVGKPTCLLSASNWRDDIRIALTKETQRGGLAGLLWW